MNYGHQEKDRWSPLEKISSGDLTTKLNETCDPRVAARLATMMFSCYRSSEASDPDMFISAASAMLANYPQEIASTVANPTVGLPSRSKWLPSISEIRDDCERLMSPRRAEAARQARQAHTAKIVASDASLQRIAKAKFDELSAKLEPQEQGGKTKPFTMAVFDGVDAFAGKALSVSSALIQQNKIRMKEVIPKAFEE